MSREIRAAIGGLAMEVTFMQYLAARLVAVARITYNEMMSLLQPGQFLADPPKCYYPVRNEATLSVRCAAKDGRRGQTHLDASCWHVPRLEDRSRQRFQVPTGNLLLSLRGKRVWWPRSKYRYLRFRMISDE